NQSKFCSKKVLTLSYNDHQSEFEEKIFWTLRVLSCVSAKNEKGFWKSTESIPEARRRFYK
ncbi:MAG: hypothetical protein AAB378_03080, partial [Patescibacteria group bacterium]